MEDRTLRGNSNSMQRTERKQVGFSNRWQLPHALDSDLLGSSQAFRAVRHGFSESLMHIMTAGSGISLSEDSTPELVSLPSLRQEKSMSLPCVVPSETSTLDQTVPKSSWRKQDSQQVLPPCISLTEELSEDCEVSLECLGTIWELHRPYLIKSNTLAQLFRKALQEETSWDLETDKQDRGEPGFAVALRNLYSSECEVDMQDVLPVLASAEVLQFPALFHHCLQMMKTGICSSTISSFYNIAERYNQDTLKEECEQWLVVNLVPKLRSQIYLGQIPEELLQKVLTSPRLFTFSEYHLFRTVLYWVYLQENPTCQILPAHSIVLTFYNSFPKICSFLESEVGQKYMPLFQRLRLHGITDARQMEEIESINILPLKWLIQILSCHYHAIQTGGDTVLHTDLVMQMVRVGLIVEQNPDYHTQLFTRYGFFFQLKVMKHHSADFSFFMQVRIALYSLLLHIMFGKCNSTRDPASAHCLL
ncbi:BTB/POZ domain-containing protein 16 [Microcaecilia unicolor]|uniref:BTB/POZ domain-containing protein 16 n=1 Tax=Microcaecilia unicolor TaxID=1415580 RepID=A0A6P7YBY9_9AMPH|nr:BTB/POZ domain-containing protein 16 [Microcaecilia unicolor]